MVEDKLEIKLLNDIEKYGLQVMRVLNEGASPGFSYSIGLFKTYKHPEIIIVGLKQELSHILINNMAEDIKNGNVFEPLNYYTGILGDFKCYIVKVRPTNYDGYVGQAQRYYKNDDFPIVQCVYPTTKGIYPWEKSWPESIKDLQPILGEIK
jgi:hypothetical protein